MRENKFIDQNKKKWQEFEDMLKLEHNDPDKLSDLFVQISDDLSYAKTFYPNRSVRFYLNNLAQQLFYKLYRTKRNTFSNFLNFWQHQLPRVVFEARKPLILSLIIFIIATIIGVFSTIQDPDFTKTILGERYVEMTKENIESGDPMAVYKKMNQVDMFLGITINNVRVALMTFVTGIFLSIGTIIVMIYNGVMIGTFQYFFAERGVFLESFLTIWLHGTLEISSIIISGGAGLTLGSGLIFPGTFSRMQSLRLSGRRGLLIMLGVVPILVFAAIIESFITRYTDVHPALRAGLIIVSFIFIAGYFIVYPWIKYKRGDFSKPEEEHVPAISPVNIDLNSISSNGEIFTRIFVLYKRIAGSIFKFSMFISVPLAFLIAFILTDILPKYIGPRNWFFFTNMFNYQADGGLWLYMINTVVLSANICFTLFLFKKALIPGSHNFIKIFSSIFPFMLIASALINLIFFTHSAFIVLLFVFIAPLILFSISVAGFENINPFTAIYRTLKLSGQSSYWKLVWLMLIIIVTSFFYFLLLDSPITFLLFEAVNWNIDLDDDGRRTLYKLIYSFISYFALNMALPLFTLGISFAYFSILESKEAVNLKERINKFGEKPKNVYTN
ncbi:MAG: stage II sporulation protein M [Cytophagaceae bacterium]